MLPPAISIVVPVYNEEGAAAPLAWEIAAAFAGLDYEMIFVDDASRDGTVASLIAARGDLPRLRVLEHQHNAGTEPRRPHRVMAASAPVVVTLDGDGQNDPADGPRLAQRLIDGPATLGLVGGRRAKRQDSAAKRLASRLGNSVRKGLLHDQASDTGCGLKAFRRDVLPAASLFRPYPPLLAGPSAREGFSVAFEDVNHRPPRHRRLQI